MGQRTGTPARRASERPSQVGRETLLRLYCCLRGGTVWSYFLAKICVCSAGCRLLQDLELKHVEVDACGDAQSAAEGAVLGLFHYDQLKSKKKTKVTAQLHQRYNHTN